MDTVIGRTLILGGGFGGIATAVELRRLVGAEHEIVLFDKDPSFAMGLRKLWELVGDGTIADGSRPWALLERHGVEFARPRSVRSTRRNGERRRPTVGSRPTTSSLRWGQCRDRT